MTLTKRHSPSRVVEIRVFSCLTLPSGTASSAGYRISAVESHPISGFRLGRSLWNLDGPGDYFPISFLLVPQQQKAGRFLITVMQAACGQVVAAVLGIRRF